MSRGRRLPQNVVQSFLPCGQARSSCARAAVADSVSPARDCGPTACLHLALLCTLQTRKFLAAASPPQSPVAVLALLPLCHKPHAPGPVRTLADRFAADPQAVERICRAPRYALRGAGKAAAGALPLLVASLPQRFEATRQPCFLYVASELIKTFGDEPARELELGEGACCACCACCAAYQERFGCPGWPRHT